MRTAKINDGGPAFPEAGMGQLASGEFHHGLPGMSLRDHFAGLAMGNLIHRAARAPIDVVEREWVATTAYAMADEMIKARAAS